MKKKKMQKALDFARRSATAMQTATAKAKELTEDQKDGILDTILCEVTTVVSNRIRLAETVLDRKVPIKTTLDLEDGRTLTITLQ